MYDEGIIDLGIYYGREHDLRLSIAVPRVASTSAEIHDVINAEIHRAGDSCAGHHVRRAPTLDEIDRWSR